MKWVCVFCGSRAINDPDFAKQVEVLVAGFTTHRWGLVYGAASVGIMGEIARAILQSQGPVKGIIPEFLKTKEILQDGLTQLISVKTLEERKTQMIQHSDAFLILPGGFGTLDELFEVLTLKQLGFHTKAISVIDHKGYFKGLKDFTQTAVNSGLITKKDSELFRVFPGADEYLKYQSDFFAGKDS